MGLTNLLEKLTSDERIDQAVQGYCEFVEREWELTWTGQNVLGKRLQLTHYIPAKIRVQLTAKECADQEERRLVEQSRAATQDFTFESNPFDNQGAGDFEFGYFASESPIVGYDSIDGKCEEDDFDLLLKIGKDRICVSERPGAGKSIFSRRLQAYLCSHRAQNLHFSGKPALVVRWEESSERSGGWPADFLSALGQIVASRLPVDCKPDDAVLQLLREGRVVIILDALDQALQTGKEAFSKFLRLLATSEGRGDRLSCQLILTCRRYAESYLQAQLETHWRMALLERWDLRRQYAYLCRPDSALAPKGGKWLERNVMIEEEAELIPRVHANLMRPEQDFASIRRSIESLIPPSKGKREVNTASPQELYWIRQICLEQLAESQSVEVAFESPGDLNYQVCNKSLKRALHNSIGASDYDSDELVEWIEELLGALAIQMLVTEPTRFAFGDKDDLASLRKNALNRVGIKMPLLPDRLIGKSPWQILTSISDFTNQVTGIFSGQTELSWPNQRLKEFYAARYLMRNCAAGYSTRFEENPLAIREDAIRNNMGNPAWSNVWSLALDLAESSHCDYTTACTSLSALFHAPRDGHRRPTRLMFRAWKVLRLPPLSIAGLPILTWFQQQFEKILESGPLSEARIAATLAPDVVLRQIVSDPERLNAILPKIDRPAFVRCPPIDWKHPNVPGRNPHVFWMGTDRKHQELIVVDERPRHPARVAPFWMQTTAVTCKQFELFDPSRRSSQPKDSPGARFTWFDAMVFAIWTGNRLPTEAQREFAARSGKDGEDDLFEIVRQKRTDNLSPDKSDSNDLFLIFSEEADDKSLASDSAQPASQAVELRSWPELQNSTARSLEPNAWQLWDMQGNGAEWCSTVYVADQYRRRAMNQCNLQDDASMSELESRLRALKLDELLPLRETLDVCEEKWRVARGGCYDPIGGCCRVAARQHFSPESELGFRLCRQHESSEQI